MATTQCFHPNVLFQFILLPFFFWNIVALVLWGNKILIGFTWKYIFSKHSSCVRLHLKRQSSFFDIYVQGQSYGGRNGAVAPSVLVCCRSCTWHLPLDLPKVPLPHGCLLLSPLSRKRVRDVLSVLQMPSVRRALEVC